MLLSSCCAYGLVKVLAEHGVHLIFPISLLSVPPPCHALVLPTMAGRLDS